MLMALPQQGTETLSPNSFWKYSSSVNGLTPTGDGNIAGFNTEHSLPLVLMALPQQGTETLEDATAYFLRHSVLMALPQQGTETYAYCVSKSSRPYVLMALPQQGTETGP